MIFVEFTIVDSVKLKVNLASIVCWLRIPGDSGESECFELGLLGGNVYRVKEDPQVILDGIARQMALGGGFPPGGVRA